MQLPLKEAIFGDFTITHKITLTNERENPHIHDVFEVLLINTDGMRCVIHDKIYYPAAGTLLLLNNMDMHHISRASEKLNNRYVVTFKPEYIQALSSVTTNLLECFFYRPFSDPCLLQLNDQELPEITGFLEQLHYHYNRQHQHAYGHDLTIKFLLGQMLLRINLIYRKRHSISSNIDTGYYSLVYNIINFLHQNYADDINLDLLARKFYINKYYMCSWFKVVTGMSPNQYLTNCRLIKAKELLLNGYCVDEVCGLTGYNNLSHFSRSFKQHFGVSPKRYQMNNRARNAL